LRRITIVIFLFFIIQTSLFGGQYLSAGLGGGYSSNLFADSFAIGNSYALYNATYSGTNFNTTQLRYYCDFSYYQYDVGDVLNNIVLTPGIALASRDRSRQFNWGIETYGTMKDYVDPDLDFDNSRYYLTGDMSYYFLPGFQSRLLYSLTKSDYQFYGNLNYFEHQAENEIIATLPTRTTFRGAARYSFRSFDERGSYYWLEQEIAVSQSINMKTGFNIKLKNRWSGDGTRPISSYYVISGITSYWDPWRGVQLESSLKRIMPFAIVSNLELCYWSRIFSYARILQQKLSWLDNATGRTDRGWTARISFNKQIALGLPTPRSMNLSFTAGYSDNQSNDDYYNYRYYYLATNLKVRLF
jgi:hypothetical protein